MASAGPIIQELRVRAVRVPMQEPHRTASGTVAESPLALIDVVTDEGVTGHGIVFTYTPAALGPTADLIRNFEPLLKGEPLAPGEIERKLARRFRLLGPRAWSAWLWRSPCGHMERWATMARAAPPRPRKTGLGEASKESKRKSGIRISRRISR